MDGNMEVEEIIIETECPNEDSEKEFSSLKEEDNDDDEFTWQQDDPFLQYDPPMKKIKKPRKKKGDVDEGSSSKAKVCGQKYKKDWENVPQFKKWLSVSLIGPEYFYCKMCKIDAKCGKSEIMRHMTSKKHTKNSQSTTSKRKNFEGLLCPVFTPIDRLRFEEVNYTKIPEYGEYLKNNNVTAILVNDIIGEGMSLTITERCLILEEWVKTCERHKFYLMVQVGGAPQKEVIRMVRHAVSKKVHALVLLPDLYNRPTDHFDLLRYIKEISDHADTLPIWYHHCPKYSNVTFDMKKFLVDVSEIESFTGVIFNTGIDDIISISAINPRLHLMVETDNAILGAAAHGFNKIMSPCLNFVPRLAQNVIRMVEADKAGEARVSQKCINDIFEVISEQGHPIASMKSAMNIISKINVGQVRRPLVDIWKKQVDQMQNEFKALGVLS